MGSRARAMTKMKKAMLRAILNFESTGGSDVDSWGANGDVDCNAKGV